MEMNPGKPGPVAPPPIQSAGTAKPQAALQPKTSGMAIASLVFGLLSTVFSCFTAIVGLILGIIALIQIAGSNGRLKGMGFAIGGVVCSMFCSAFAPFLLLPLVQSVRSEARQAVALDNFRTVNIAHHNYQSAFMKLPQDICDDNGRPLLSWRVRLLPYIGHRELFDRFNLEEPWDSPNNLPLADLMPHCFEHPGAVEVPFNHTVFQHPIGNGALFEVPQPGTILEARRFSDIRDGMAMTIMMVEANAEDAVLWTKPADYVFDPQNPKRGLGNSPRGLAIVAFADGSCSNIDLNAIDETDLAASFTYNGGEIVSAF